MAPSPQKRKKQAGSVPTNIYSLPDELLLKIIKIAAEDGSTNEENEERDDEYSRAWFVAMPHLRPYVPPATPCCQYNHRLVADVISEISVRFNRLARDPSLWRCHRSKFFPIPRDSATMNSLPDKVILKIVDAVSTISAEEREKEHFTYSRDHGYLVDIISQEGIKRFFILDVHLYR